MSPEKSPPMINLEVDLADDEHFYNNERIESIESFATIQRNTELSKRDKMGDSY